ncbi:MAG TPA: hybrid sensor histidine kinase/response regulator [Limnobacter sp.]|nr:hybrid sensor histidine kinase/response regulator [Limnobacter sp.]
MQIPDPRQQIILHEQTRLLLEHLPFVLYGVLASSTGLVAVLWQWTDRANLLIWLASVYLLTAGRFAFRKRFLKQGVRFNASEWLKPAIFLVAASGSLWGIAGIVFFSNDPAILLALSIFLAAMVSGSVSSHACYTPAYIAFALPATLPFITRCFLEGDSFHAVLGSVALVFVLVNIYYGRNLQRMVIQSLKLRFQNDELLAELTLQKQVAEEASHAKTRFLATISHDLRQPVQAIELLVDALREDLAGHPSHYMLEHIQEAGTGLRNLLNTMLDSSKINAAAITPRPRHFPLAPLLARICRESSVLAQQKGLALRLVNTRAWAYADPDLLELIIRNYVENAIKYTRKGKVLVGCRHRGKQLRIEVHDTGIGIPTHAQGTIFQEFYRLDDPERDRAKGLGLGLYIAQSLARLMNCAIGVKSTPGEGSLFHVSVPEGERGTYSENPSSANIDPSTLVGKTVLLIEDDDMVRASVTEMLNRWQCRTISAEDVDSALRRVAALGTRPDAIVADYRLRNKRNGMDAVQTLQKRLGKIPAVILTGDTTPVRIQEVQKSGCAILHKPLRGVELRNVLIGLIMPSSQQAG